MEFDAAIKLWGESTDRVCERVDALGDRLSRDQKPFFKIVGGSGTVDAGGDNLLIMCDDSPNVGRIWNILGFGAFSGGIGSTVAGNADFFAGQLNPSLITGEFDYAGCLGRNVSINSPGNMIQTRLSAFCRYGEHCYAWIRGVAANTNIALVFRIHDYPLEAIETMAVG